MTTDQHARCAALAKRIAELDPNWAANLLGVAVDCGGYSLRFVGCVGHPHMGADDGWVNNPVQAQYRKLRGGSGDTVAALFDRPTVCAPDYTDQATLGALLLSLGEQAEVAPISGVETTWYAFGHTFGHTPVTCEGDTRAEAILAAKVAQLEAK